MKRRILVVLAVLVPLALFFAARVAASKRPLIIGEHKGATGLQFSPDGKSMLSYGSADVSSWNLSERRREATWKSGLSYVFSPDGQSLVATGNSYGEIDKGVELCDVKTGEVARSWKIKSPVVPKATALIEAVSPDSRFLAVGFDGKAAGTTRIYRISDAKFWESPVDSAPFMGFSADSRLAIFAENSTFLARDMNNGREVQRMNVPDAQSCFLAPDGRHIYNVDRQGVIRCWDVR